MNAKPSDLVTQLAKSVHSYQEALPHLKSMVKTNDMKVIKAIISQIKKLIKDRKCTPSQKILCLDLFHECLMLKIPNFLNFAQEKILERLSILAAKKPHDLFRDSQKSQQNLELSEEFLKNLLNYIQIWASNFGRGVGGQSTFYGTIYNQLKSNKVAFPPMSRRESFKSDPIRTEESKSKQSTIRQAERPAARPSSIRNTQLDKTDNETLDYLDNMLVIVEELEDPFDNETGKELIQSITDLKKNLDDILNKALNRDDSILTEKVLKISERVQKALQGNKEKDSRKSLYSTTPSVYQYNSRAAYDPKIESVYDLSHENILDKKDLNKREKFEQKFKSLSEEKGELNVISEEYIRHEPQAKIKLAQGGQEEVKHVINIEKIPEIAKKDPVNAKIPEVAKKESVNIFDDILNLDIEPISSPPPKAAFNSMQPVFPSLFSPFDSMNNFNPSPGSPRLQFNTMSMNNPFPLSPAINDSPQASSTAELENLMHQLKEKEDKIVQLSSQVTQLQAHNEALEQALKRTKDLLTSKEKECEEFHVLKKQEIKLDLFEDFGKILSLPSPQKLEIEPEVPADNENIFKFVTCEELAVIYDSSLFQIGFQLSYEPSSVKLTFYISNKSGDLIQNIRLSASGKGFNIQFDNTSFANIPINSQIFFTVHTVNTDITSAYPRLNIDCVQGSDNYGVNLKIPINICQFASPVTMSAERIWQEWEDLLFAGENFVVKCKNGKQYVPKLLKLGKNLMVFNSELMPKLGSRDYLIAANIGELVLGVVKIKRKEEELDLEIRSNNVKLREHVMKLLVSNLSE